MLPSFPSFSKPVISLCWSGICWASQLVLGEIPSGDLSWFQLLLKDVGLPIAFLILMIYCVIALYGELKAANTGRNQDRDIFQKQLIDMIQRAQERQERQTIATDNLSNEFSRLSDRIGNCQRQQNN